ncbi:MAG: hypothetical protein P4K86_02010 [Terracidiphilus sp.]|nr:hypothetical protein [Terracidiphilus sp.]
MKTTCGQKLGRIAEQISLAVLLAASGSAATAQSPGATNPGPHASQSIAVVEAGSRQDADLVVREIDDPHLGVRWLLMRDRNHPAGPGRLVLSATPNRPVGQGESGGTLSPIATEMPFARTVIRAGDRLVVEENTTVVEARLEAVALGNATLGSTFDVRLKLSGKLARVVALAPGRAAFQAQTEARP